MRGEKVKGALALTGLLVLGLLLLFGLLAIALVLVLFAILLFLGFYAYIRLKLWWERRRPPKELESPHDYI